MKTLFPILISVTIVTMSSCGVQSNSDFTINQRETVSKALNYLLSHKSDLRAEKLKFVKISYIAAPPQPLSISREGHVSANSQLKESLTVTFRRIDTEHEANDRGATVIRAEGFLVRVPTANEPSWDIGTAAFVGPKVDAAAEQDAAANP